MSLLAASRLARVAASSSKKAIPASSVGAGRYFLSTEASSSSSSLTREDVTDSDGLLQFKTLYEMNHYASIAFKDNPLFGTYKAPVTEENIVKDQKEVQGEFEWMTYGEYGELVGRCRTVLKDIGKSTWCKNVMDMSMPFPLDF